MKPVLVMDGKEITLSSLELRDGKVSQVGYFDEEKNYHTLFDSKNVLALDGYETVENLDSKVIVKDDFMTKIVHSIEEFLSDEEKMLLLKGDEVAEANRDLISNSNNWKNFIDASLVRQEQFGRVDGIAETLNLVKLSLGYKD